MKIGHLSFFSGKMVETLWLNFESLLLPLRALRTHSIASLRLSELIGRQLKFKFESQTITKSTQWAFFSRLLHISYELFFESAVALHSIKHVLLFEKNCENETIRTGISCKRTFWNRHRPSPSVSFSQNFVSSFVCLLFSFHFFSSHCSRVASKMSLSIKRLVSGIHTAIDNKLWILIFYGKIVVRLDSARLESARLLCSAGCIVISPSSRIFDDKRFHHRVVVVNRNHVISLFGMSSIQATYSRSNRSHWFEQR